MLATIKSLVTPSPVLSRTKAMRNEKIGANYDAVNVLTRMKKKLSGETK